MNKTKLLKLADCMEDLPKESFDMRTWANRDNTTEQELNSACGTTCCIAGWQQAFRGRSVWTTGSVYEYGAYKGDAPVLASRDLELDLDERQMLFHRNNWPKTEAGSIMFPNTPKGAADRIRYMVETGK